MHARMRLGLLGTTLLVWVLLAGCAGEPAPPPATAPDLSGYGQSHDHERTGIVRGRVVWDGPIPVVAPFHAAVVIPDVGIRPLPDAIPNPNAPRVHPDNRGLANAVVWLRGVDCRQACPWPHDSVEVILSRTSLTVRQGESRSSYGIVRRGGEVAMVSADPLFLAVRAEGAAFFTLTLPRPQHVRRRALLDRGIVQLSCGLGHFWQRAYLFVDDHPYYARTDENGAFCLQGVPAGHYELVCWAPNWNVQRLERNPESAAIDRIRYQPAVETMQSVHVDPAREQTVVFRLGSDRFPK